MSVPVLLVCGFLGSGKTTLINHLLHNPQGRRIAAIVNDFGAIDIDAALLGGAAEGVVSLKNGCICCTLQGDLLRTLRSVLRRDPAPEAIVIETSGVSDPAEIVRALLDPVIWAAAALDTVLCVADALHLHERPGLFDDALCRSQFASADFIALSKPDLVAPARLRQVRDRLRALKPDRTIHEMQDGVLPPELLFSSALHRPATAATRRAEAAGAAFQSVVWLSDAPLALDRFQAAIGRAAGQLVRAKGVIEFAGQPGRRMLFQLAGSRATIAPAPPGDFGAEAARLVFIARDRDLNEQALLAGLDASREPPARNDTA